MLDGKTFFVKDAQPGVNFHPMHPNCRCTDIIALDDDTLKNLQRRARDPETGRNELVPAGTTWEEWKKQNILNGNGSIGSSLGPNTVTPITEKAIESVKIPEGVNLPEPMLKRIEQFHKDVLRESKEKNGGKEVAFLIDKAGNLLTVKHGTEKDLDLTCMELGRAKYIVHNHPNNSSFSNLDIIEFARNKGTDFLAL